MLLREDESRENERILYSPPYYFCYLGFGYIGGIIMADRCPHCGTGVGPLAVKCYKCGGMIGPEQRTGPAPVQKKASGNFFWMSVVFGILGIILSPMVWTFVVDLTSSAICSMYTFSVIFGFGAFIMGAIMLFKNKDKRGWVGLIAGIIVAILVLIPIVFVMVTPFGGIITH